MVSHNIRVPALIPLLVRQRIQIVELGEFREARVSDDDVEPPERADRLRDAVFDVGDLAAVALDDGRFDLVGLSEFLGEGEGGGFAVDVVDGDVGAFGGEFSGDFGAETSGLECGVSDLGGVWMSCPYCVRGYMLAFRQ